jgi:hypothetical protein
MRRLILAAAVLAGAAGAALGDMSFAGFFWVNPPDAVGPRNSSGTLIDDGTYVMLIDLDNDGWQGIGYGSQSSTLANNGSWLWDADDLILDRGQISGGECYPARMLSSPAPAGYTPNVDHVYVLWFDTPWNESAAGPGANVRYGAEDLGTAGADPGDYSFYPRGGNATLRTISGPPLSWHNNALPADVNGDGNVTEADAQLIMDKLNLQGPHTLQLPGDPLPASGGAYWDVSGDDVPYLSPLDALMVINTLEGLGGSYSVPEPASLLAMALGGALLLRRRASSGGR